MTDFSIVMPGKLVDAAAAVFFFCCLLWPYICMQLPCLFF